MTEFDKLTAADMVPASGEPDIIIGTREQLFHLLAEAAEVEHTLMCSYLYAAFSLRPENSPDLSVSESRAVVRWRASIMSVAIEEMGHLVIVSNLTAALGARPHLTRPKFPVSSGYFPSLIRLRLTPFSRETIDHFIYLERPLGDEGDDAPGFEADPAPRQQAHNGLMPSTQDYGTVSHLYTTIRENLIALCDRVGPENTFIGSSSAQIGPAVLQMEGVEEITDLEAALKCLGVIVEQGEGATHAGEDCHYQKFTQIKEELERHLLDNPQFNPAHAVVSNPVMRQSALPDETAFIEDGDAARLLDFCNAVYNLLLRALVQAYCQSRSDSAQSRFIDLAISMMHVMAIAVSQLITLPANDGSAEMAGISFTTLRGLHPFQIGPVENLLILERITQISATSSQLQQRYGEFGRATSLLETAKSQFQADR